MKIRPIIIPAAAAALALTAGLAAGAGGGYSIGHDAGTESGTAAGFKAGNAIADARVKQCRYALSESERVLGLTTEALEVAADSIVAAGAWDWDELERLTVEVDEIAAEIGDPTGYHTARDACFGEGA